MKVKIIVGAYGYRPAGSSYVTPIFQGEICEVDGAEGEYLVRTGAAVEAEGPESEPRPTVPDVLDTSTVGNLPEEPEALEEASREPDDEYLETLSFEELKVYAERLGVSTRGLRSKLAVREAIAASFHEEADTDEAPPELGAAEVIA